MENGLMENGLQVFTNDSDNVRCPVCNEICDTIYMDKNGKVFACDNCVIDQDSYTWNFEKHNSYTGGN